MYTVYVNNKLYSILNTTNAVNYNYAVAQNLNPSQSYTVKLVRSNIFHLIYFKFSKLIVTILGKAK